ncbi:hypothetical protein ACP70R_009688 [Stipagrostis hirtigluma subsp. patula]
MGQENDGESCASAYHVSIDPICHSGVPPIPRWSCALRSKAKRRRGAIAADLINGLDDDDVVVRVIDRSNLPIWCPTDSAMGLRNKAKRRRRAIASAAVTADLISALCDDLLVRILELLPNVRDAARTDALSRRWRGLWTRIPALRFSSDCWPVFREPRDVERYISVVDDALDHRAAQREPAVERLAISFDMRRVRVILSHAPPMFLFKAAQRWIQHAARHEMRSFDLGLSYPQYSTIPHEPGEHELALDILPSSKKMETLRLALDHAVVQLPATALFVSLTELSLECMFVAHETGNLLARLLSSACCPRLQKLRLHEFWFKKSKKLQELEEEELELQELEVEELELEELVLEAGELLELSWEEVGVPWTTLELRTPNLRVIRMACCSGSCWDRTCVETLRVSAPRLENLMFLDDHQPDIDIDSELPRVRSLKVKLNSHGNDQDTNGTNDGTIRLLQCCTKAKCLEVSLRVPKSEHNAVDIIKGRIPHLPHVTSLKVHVNNSWVLHSYGVGVASLLSKCSNLRYLCLHLGLIIGVNNYSKSEFFCNHTDDMKSHEISLPHLRKVEFKELAGVNCEVWFMQSVLSSAMELQKMAICFNKMYWQKNRVDVVDLFLPVLEGGKWTACQGSYLSYKWRRRL